MNIQPEDFCFTDIEASGLGKDTFPIEIGWTDITLKPNSFLIKPHKTWTKEFWNPESEKIHNISWEKLMDEGIKAEDAAERVKEIFKNKIIVSDAPSYEAKWFLRLFESTNTPCNFVFRDLEGDLHTSIQDIYEAWTYAAKISIKDNDKIDFNKIIDTTNDVSNYFPHTHRASDDAILMAATFKVILEPDWNYKKASELFKPIG